MGKIEGSGRRGWRYEDGSFVGYGKDLEFWFEGDRSFGLEK